MEDEKKIETPEEKVETAVPLEKEDIYGNDEFVDAKKPEPVVEEKTEPEPEPEPEEEPEPQPEAIYQVRTCQRCDHLRYGADACPV